MSILSSKRKPYYAGFKKVSYCTTYPMVILKKLEYAFF